MPKAVRNISMNMYRGVLLAGYGLFPSCYSMLLNYKNSKILPSEEPLVVDKEYKYSLSL